MGLKRVRTDVYDLGILLLEELLTFYRVTEQGFVGKRVEVEVSCRCADVGVVHVERVGTLEFRRAETAAVALVWILWYLDALYWCYLSF